MVAVELRIEYKRELVAGDLITIRSFVQETREKSLLFVHEMTNQETQELASRTVLTGVCIDMNTRKARPLPADIRERIVREFPDSAHEQIARGLRQQEAQ